MTQKVNLNQIATETRNQNTLDLDRISPRQIARKINNEDLVAARAVQKANKEIAQVMMMAAEAYAGKHKIIFMGAGTSGRLGILEAVECVPTFGTKPSEIIGIIAGGRKAIFRAQEGAEDSATLGANDVTKNAKKGDLVVGLTASGRTPYVMGALKKAQQIGARTALISCNGWADTTNAEVHVFLPTGPEALCGSTRMKAGTATKMALNAITTGAMTLCGKTYHNLMIDVQPTNLKLVARATRLICEVAKTDEKTAAKLLKAAGQHVKTAVVMHCKKVNKKEAEKLLKKCNGFLTKVIDD